MAGKPEEIQKVSIKDADSFHNLIRNIRSPGQKPLIPFTPATEVRFEPPSAVNFSVTGSLFSVLSLVLMSVLSLGMYLNLTGVDTGFPANITAGILALSGPVDTPAWVWTPFLFTIFGSTLGWVFELGLLLSGKPFQMNLNRFTTFIQKIRFLNLAPVVTSILFFVSCIVLQASEMRYAMLFICTAGVSGLGVALFLGGAWSVPLILAGIQLVQVAMVLAAATPPGGWEVAAFLVAQGLTQLTALLTGTATPVRSTLFHVISTASGLLLFLAIARVMAYAPDFPGTVAPVVEPWSLLMWLLVVTFIGGISFTMKKSPMTYGIWRAGASNLIWSLQYFLLVSAKRFPNPFNLSFVYKNGAPDPAKIRPYYQQHPEYLPQALSIPAVEKIERNVTLFSGLVKKVKTTFAIIAKLDHFFPQADINIPLSHKPRMKVWSSGEDIYPAIYRRNLFGYTVPGKGLEKTPEPALRTFRQGQLLAYLAESGVANPLLTKAPEEGKGMLTLDFRFLEKYETKTDYEPYGGRAFLRVDSSEKRLILESLTLPHSDRRIPANPDSATFRRAESIILASLYYQVISGKHLTEIHMTYNLVEVAMHNAFDAKGQFNHPVRTFMYLHLFSHELAEELTTEHLVQEGAVFSQIFATTHDSLVSHLNDCYQNFEYGTDENFETRKEAMTMNNGELLPNACIKWELKYAETWQRYTDDMINSFYQDDASVQNDQYVQALYSGLNEVIMQGLPVRYDNFQSRKGLSRWASDTIHHLVVRHQVYGTTGVKASLDPRISNTQVPKDGCPPGVDEWRSLVGVALATARARFVLLKGKQDRFFYLLKGVDQAYVPVMEKAFAKLQQDLETLEQEWTADSDQENFNYNFFRPLPSELHTGAGY